MSNTLNLQFGPNIPVDLDTIGLAFVSTVPLGPDGSVANLSAERYVKENYAHKHQHSIIESPNSNTTVTINVDGYDNSNTQTVPLIKGTDGKYHWYLETLHSPIKVKGIGVTKAGTWNPIIQPGIVWRKYTVPSSESTSLTLSASLQNSWLLRSGLTKGDVVYLIYTVPECFYGTVTTSGLTTFPGPTVKMKELTEFANIVAVNKIQVSYPINVIREVTVNGVVKYTGIFDGTSEDTYIKTLKNGDVVFSVSDGLSPDDLVKVTYYTYSDFYSYSGFRNHYSIWNVFDCNPESGHYISESGSGYSSVYSSVNALQQQVTIYLIPTAYAKVMISDSGQTTGNLGSINVSFVSAYDYNETHFVRHIVGQDSEFIQSNQSAVTNTYGHAVFGRNRFDEMVLSNDTFSTTVPMMMPIGKILLTAPASMKSISAVDIRQRGGGVPEDFSMDAVNTQENGLDTLRGYWDLGIFEGAVVNSGGVVQIEINSSVLNDFTSDQIHEVVSNQLPPGVVYEIKFVES